MSIHGSDSNSESILRGTNQDETDTLHQLTTWPVSGIGLHPGGSNYVFVVRLTDPEIFDPESVSDEPEDVDESASIYAIYKPQAGERPLKDFPGGTLHKRERAAYLVSKELGWPNVPPTVIRSGPHGEGSFQLFIDAAIGDEETEPDNYFTLRDSRLDDFRDIAMFDVLLHNADRKGGSCIVDPDGVIWAIDHGLTFNYTARRRTVMFEFNGTEYAHRLLEDVSALANTVSSKSELSSELSQLLAPHEVSQLATTCKEMEETGQYPVLDPDINVPWPMV